MVCSADPCVHTFATNFGISFDIQFWCVNTITIICSSLMQQCETIVGEQGISRVV